MVPYEGHFLVVNGIHQHRLVILVFRSGGREIPGHKVLFTLLGIQGIDDEIPGILLALMVTFLHIEILTFEKYERHILMPYPHVSSRPRIARKEPSAFYSDRIGESIEERSSF